MSLYFWGQNQSFYQLLLAERGRFISFLQSQSSNCIEVIYQIRTENALL